MPIYKPQYKDKNGIIQDLNIDYNSLANKPTTKNEIDSLKSNIDNLNKTIINGVIDGSPKGVYANLSALQTALPDGASGVYLTRDNGHWYFWNDTEWIDGGVYRSDEDYNTLKSDIGNLNNNVDKLEDTKANVNGYYETFGYAREAGIAKNIQNDEGKLLDPDTSTSSGTVYADTPFVQRATAMTMKAYLDNELITVGSGYEQWRKEQAFSIVRNQYAKELINDNYYAQSTASITYNDGVATFLANATNDAIATKPISNFCIANHRYFISCKLKLTTATNKVYLELRDGTGVLTIAATQETANEQTIMGIVEARSAFKNAYVRIIDTRTDGLDSITIYNFKTIDLTQWFASRPEIAEALNGDAGIKWFLQNYPQALSLGYDEGTIVDTEDYEYQTIGVNLWDEEWEVGGINSDTGINETSKARIRSKNYISVLPNTNYYLKGTNAFSYVMYYDINQNYISYVTNKDNSIVNIPTNAYYLRFVNNTYYGTTYKYDIQICQHFTETSVEQTYHKYEIFKDRVSWAFTSTGKGKSAGKAADTKDYVNKKNIEKVGRVAFAGNENWTFFDSSDSFWYTSNFIPQAANSKIDGANICSNNIVLKIISDGRTIRAYLKDNPSLSSSSNMNEIFKAGTVLNYELATPVETDMSGDEFNTNIPENDYGVERKVALSGNMFSGSATTILYQDNPLRQIYNNKSSIDNLQEEITDASLNARGYYKMIDLSGSITNNANLTIQILRAYRIGNIVSLSIRANNSTGSEIPASTILFTLPSSAIPKVFTNGIGLVANETKEIDIDYNGNISTPNALPNYMWIMLYITYAVS